MNKIQFIKRLSERTGYKDTEIGLIVDTFIDIIGEELCKGNKILFYGFGHFVQWKQVERPGRNVKTGEPYQIPSRISVKFKAGKCLLEQLNTVSVHKRK